MKPFLKAIRLFSLTALFLSSHFILNTAHAVSTKALTLRQLTGLANRIVDATLIDKRVELDSESGYQVTYYTFRVNECFKGDVGSQLVIKLATPDDGEGLGGRNRFGLTDYKSNQRILGFFAGDSLKGLTAPIGLNQGEFILDEDANGEVTVRGLSQRKFLLNDIQRQLPTRALTSRELSVGNGNDSYSDFRSLIQTTIFASSEDNSVGSH